jgi:hypothetical protein
VGAHETQESERAPVAALAEVGEVLLRVDLQFLRRGRLGLRVLLGRGCEVGGVGVDEFLAGPGEAFLVEAVLEDVALAHDL